MGEYNEKSRDIRTGSAGALRQGFPGDPCTAGETTGCFLGPGPSCASEQPWQNPRDLIDQRIDLLNRQTNELHALRRALPSEMLPHAERALVDILSKAFSR